MRERPALGEVTEKRTVRMVTAALILAAPLEEVSETIPYGKDLGTGRH
jgi:hypothetical protein